MKYIDYLDLRFDPKTVCRFRVTLEEEINREVEVKNIDYIPLQTDLCL